MRYPSTQQRKVLCRSGSQETTSREICAGSGLFLPRSKTGIVRFGAVEPGRDMHVGELTLEASWGPMETKRRLEGIVASAMDAIITVDHQQHIILFNPAAERMFEVAATRAIGQHISRFIPEKYRVAHEDHIRRFTETGVTSRQMGALGAISGLRANGEEFPIEASISHVEVGNERLATVILRDITERKASEDALRDSRRRLEGIVDSAMDAIISVDERQRIILFNPAAERMFGVSADTALGRPISKFIPERFRAAHDEHIRHFRETGVTNRRMGALGAISGLRSNGQEFPVEASISHINIGGERIATVILRDITERQANEDARLLLAREVDHRAKNALAVIQALVSLTTAPTKEAFVAAVRGRVAALARAHSVLARNRWEGAELAQILADETSAFERPGQLTWNGPPVTLSPEAVQPVSLLIHELATNAVKHGALAVEQGTVHVHWRVLPGGRLEFRWEERGGPRVREPSSKGFGSTLIAQVTRRQLEGDLQLRWQTSGLELVATLPADVCRIHLHPSPAREEDEAESAPSEATCGRILVVEDEMLVAMEICDQLSSQGWDVIGPASTLDEAFGIMAEALPPQAAVLDVNLKGQLVYPLADLLRSRAIPIVFCTGYEDVDARYGEHSVVRKPADVRFLGAELRRIIGQLPSTSAA